MNEMGHSFDTAMPMEKLDFAILGRVDEIIGEAVDTGNPMLIFGFGVALRKAAQSSGLGLAKLLASGRDNWHNFKSDDDFATVAKWEMGISDDTYNKYTRVWDHVVCSLYLREHDDIREQVMSKPIRGLILLTAAAREDQLRAKDWKKIANAPNVDTIRNVVRDVRGWQTSASTALSMMLSADGQLTVRIGGGGYEIMGQLKRDGSTESEAMISRFERAGLMVEAK